MTVTIRFKIDDGDFNYGEFPIENIPDNIASISNALYSYLKNTGFPLNDYPTMLSWSFSIRNIRCTEGNFLSMKNYLETGDVLHVFFNLKDSLVMSDTSSKDVLLVKGPGLETRLIDSSSPYTTPICFGHYITPVRSPILHPMDNEPIKLNAYPPHYRKEIYARLLALAYAEKYKDADCLTKIKRTTVDSNIFNIITSECQTGKTEFLVKTSWLAFYQNLKVGIFVMNNGGTGHMIRIAEEMKKFTTSIITFLMTHHGFTKEFLETFFSIDLFTREEMAKIVSKRKSLIKRRRMRENSSFSDIFNKPFMYISRSNKEGITGFSNCFEGLSSCLEPAIISDEDHNFRQSLDGFTGVAEIAAFFTGFRESSKSLRQVARLIVAFTATPLSLIYTKNVDYPSIPHLIYVESPKRHVGFSYLVFPHNGRKVELIATEPKKAGSTVLECDTGILVTVKVARDFFLSPSPDSYANVLISTSKNRGSNSKSRDACPDLLISAPEAVVFCYNCDVGSDFFFNLDMEKRDMLLERLAQKFESHFFFDDDGVLFSFKKYSIAISFDIVKLICSYKSQKFFAICLGGNSANLGNTFKTSNHEYPVTHGYMSEKDPKNYCHDDMEQMTGRIQSNDQVKFSRFLFMPQASINNLVNAYKTKTSTVSAFSGNTTLTGPQITANLRLTDPGHYLLYVIDNCVKKSKNGINEEIDNENGMPIISKSQNEDDCIDLSDADTHTSFLVAYLFDHRFTHPNGITSRELLVMLQKDHKFQIIEENGHVKNGIIYMKRSSHTTKSPEVIYAERIGSKLSVFGVVSEKTRSRIAARKRLTLATLEFLNDKACMMTRRNNVTRGFQVGSSSTGASAHA